MSENDHRAGLAADVNNTTAAAPRRQAHTPGPWVTFYKHKYNEWHVSLPCEDSQMRVALCPDGVPGSTVEECEANAHLIAAAPELLAACRHVINAILLSEIDMELVHAAIAKAEGKS